MALQSLLPVLLRGVDAGLWFQRKWRAASAGLLLLRPQLLQILQHLQLRFAELLLQRHLPFELVALRRHGCAAGGGASAAKKAPEGTGLPIEPRGRRPTESCTVARPQRSNGSVLGRPRKTSEALHAVARLCLDDGTRTEVSHLCLCCGGVSDAPRVDAFDKCADQLRNSGWQAT